jgi:hypothetical protein
LLESAETTSRAFETCGAMAFLSEVAHARIVERALSGGLIGLPQSELCWRRRYLLLRIKRDLRPQDA